MSVPEKIFPGNWLGVLGGGQLGRMFTHAAQRMGYHVAVYDPAQNCPAAQAAERHWGVESPDAEPDSMSLHKSVVAEMAQACSAVTLEFENIPKVLVEEAARHTRTHPGARFLAMCQDRIQEKSSLAAAGFPTTPFQSTGQPDDVRQAVEAFGLPLVLKTSTSGYDGKGQTVIRAADQIESAWKTLHSAENIAEKWIDFAAEVSMLVARNLSGQIESFPLLENEHANHILDVTRCPVSPALQAYEQQAREICHGIAEKFEVIGIFCVEFFVAKSGELLINEVAPRPHNSGHLTIEAFACSQFEQQVRAICNLPLLASRPLRPAAMVNLLGDLWSSRQPDWSQVLRCPDAHLHLYGKSEARPGRKMGHITVLDEESSLAAAELARKLRSALTG